MELIQQSTASVEDTRRHMVLALLQERYKNEDVPPYFIEQEAEYFLSLIEDGKPIFTPRPQAQTTDAGSVNQEMREYEIDIHSIYTQLAHLGERISQHQKLNASILNDVSIRIRKVNENLEQIGQVIRSDATHSVFYETFLDYNGKEQNDLFYTDRFGNRITAANHLSLDEYQQALKLPMAYSENKLVNFAGVKLASVKITKQIGQGFIKNQNPKHRPDQAIDTSLSTYWSETILTDEPLEVSLGANYYDVDFGAACELEVTFDYISSLNEITLMPFSEYPLQLVSIKVFTTDSDEEDPYELVSPQGFRKGDETSDIISYQFQDIAAKRIKLFLNQQHYIKQDYMIEVDDKTMIDAWLKNQEFVEVEAGKVFKPVYRDQFEISPAWYSLKEYLEKKDVDEDIVRYEDMDTGNKIHVSKYAYQYGLHNIAMNRNNYLSSGVFVTKPLINSNVHVVTLDAKETHAPLAELNTAVTSAEFYITDSENPAAEDWIPILPKSTKEIVSERLFFRYEEDFYKATTRFSISFLNHVRKNGHPLRPNKDFSVSGRAIRLESFDPSAVYTADYRPMDTAYHIDFMQRYTITEFHALTNEATTYLKTKKAMEEYAVVKADSVVSLNHYPFVDKTKLNAQAFDWNATYLSNAYLPFRVRLQMPDGTYIDQLTEPSDESSVYLTNKTDYFDPGRSLLEPFNGLNYQYRLDGSQIKFNTKLPEGTSVFMEYPYLTGPIRMKVIMRRNVNEIEGLTGLLEEYKLNFQMLT